MYCRLGCQLILATSPYLINIHIVTSINKYFHSLNHSILSSQSNQGILFYPIQSACIAFHPAILTPSYSILISPQSFKLISHISIKNSVSLELSNSRSLQILILQFTKLLQPNLSTRQPLPQHRRNFRAETSLHPDPIHQRESTTPVLQRDLIAERQLRCRGYKIYGSIKTYNTTNPLT